MTDFQVVPTDMAAASDAVTEGGAEARGHGSSGHLSTAAGAVPGSKSAGWLGELGTSWDEEVDTWATSAETFAAQIDAASKDAQGTDQQSGGWFVDLIDIVTGGR